VNEERQIPEVVFSEKNPYRILVVDRRRRTAEGLKKDLGNHFRIDHAVTADTALQMLGLSHYDLVVLQLKLPLFSGMELAVKLKELKPDLAVLPVGPPDMTNEAEKIRKLGYPPPIPPDKNNYLEIVQRCREYMDTETWYRNIDRLRDELDSRYNYNRMLSLTPEIHEIYSRLSRVSDASVPILITGESGTGKELVARMIHDACDRVDRPFVTINCAAVPEGLLESQFFGHEKGAFTGAIDRSIGKFEQAHNGTLFLDEIGDMSPALQAKLLRVIEYGEFERVGGHETISVDVRLLTATNRDLEKRVSEKEFRSDLFYRINVFPVHLPPLRKRGSDILLLAYHFLRRLGQRNNRQVNIIHPDSIQLLQEYLWHGNIRELENTMERAILLSDGVRLKPEDFPQLLEIRKRQRQTSVFLDTTSTLSDVSQIRPLKDVERDAIDNALKLNEWNIALTARQLGISRNTLYRKIEEHGMSAPEEEQKGGE